MGKYLDLWDLTEGQPEARQELEALLEVKAKATVLVNILDGLVELDVSSNIAVERLFAALKRYNKVSL